MRYCDGRKISFGNTKSGYDFSGNSNMHELKLLMEERFMIRRLKSDVLSQLPAKSREMIILDPSLVKSKSKVMQEKANRFMHRFKPGEEHSILLEWFSLTSEAKSKAVCDYLKDLIEGGKKFLCFAHHHVSLSSSTLLYLPPNLTFSVIRLFEIVPISL